MDKTPVFVERRRRLARLLSGRAALVSAGHAPPRNYLANTYDFRASSHFLYLTGLTHAPGAALLVEAERSTLFLVPPAPDDALWHGPVPSFAELKAQCGADRVLPLEDLEPALAQIGASSGRLPLPAQPSEADLAVGDAIIELRLRHDPAAQAELRRAAEVTSAAHRAGMAVTGPGVRESVVRAAMEQVILAADFTTAYGSIVTVRGEVLHSHDRSGTCQAGDLLLADVGAETDSGWAGDVTRTWPVSGRFSPTQRALYEVVLAAQLAAIDAARPGARYRDVHLCACRVIAAGLRDEGILRGEVDGLVERGAHALFFPHGVGHLLGLDVHDMEDLGDRAGYAPGRARAAQFGLSYLRLDRDLQPGMAVTIEPGIYLVPSILSSTAIAGPLEDALDRHRLAAFSDVRGIRIEDDILITEGGAQVLTQGIPKTVAEVEAAVGAAR